MHHYGLPTVLLRSTAEGCVPIMPSDGFRRLVQLATLLCRSNIRAIVEHIDSRLVYTLSKHYSFSAFGD